jgi:hypothetical protein
MRYGVDALSQKLVEVRLVDKISPAFELRNPGVPAVARSFQLSIIAWISNEHARVSLPGMSAGHRVPLAYFGYNFAWSLLTKGAIAGIDKRRCAGEALQTHSPPARPCP